MLCSLLHYYIVTDMERLWVPWPEGISASWLPQLNMKWPFRVFFHLDFACLFSVLLSCISFPLFIAQWMVPLVTGDVPPPVAEFSFTKISSDQAVLFGGCVLGGVSSELWLATVNWDNVVGGGCRCH